MSSTTLLISTKKPLYTPTPFEKKADMLVEKVNDVYMTVTTHRLWRHSIGRVTSVVKVAIYATALCAQTAKTVFKAVLSPFASLGVWFCGGKQHEWSWTMEGVAKDAIMIACTFDKGISALIGVACAPHKNSNSIFSVMCYYGDILNGSYHNIKKSKPETPSQLFEWWKAFRADWSELIFDSHRNIPKKDTSSLSVQVAERIKAG